jgi:hypothetical protein
MIMHQAIVDSITWWSKPDFQQSLSENPPSHTSYYCVDEGDDLRVYGVRWHGADLSKGEVFTPDNEAQLLAEVRPIIANNRLHGGRIGGSFMLGDKQIICDSYVFDSPLRRVKEWMPSIAGSYVRPNDEIIYEHAAK